MKYPPGCRVATAMRRIIQCKRVLWELKFSVQGRPSKSLNHEGAGRSRFFEVKQFEYTLFEGILLRMSINGVGRILSISETCEYGDFLSFSQYPC